jgi:hypothetical protein
VETFSNLWHGRIGLVRAYWLWGIVGGALWGIPLALVTPGSGAAVLIVLAFLAYYVIVNTGIWRSASAYTGPKVWAVLAHIGAGLGYISLVILVLTMIAGGREALVSRPSATDSTPQTERPAPVSPVTGKPVSPNNPFLDPNLGRDLIAPKSN